VGIRRKIWQLRRAVRIILGIGGTTEDPARI
jgi:hypothetical protein